MVGMQTTETVWRTIQTECEDQYALINTNNIMLPDLLYGYTYICSLGEDLLYVCVYVHVHVHGAVRGYSICVRMRPYISGRGPGQMTLIGTTKDAGETTHTTTETETAPETGETERRKAFKITFNYCLYMYMHINHTPMNDWIPYN